MLFSVAICWSVFFPFKRFERYFLFQGCAVAASLMDLLWILVMMMSVLCVLKLFYTHPDFCASLAELALCPKFGWQHMACRWPCAPHAPLEVLPSLRKLLVLSVFLIMRV